MVILVAVVWLVCGVIGTVVWNTSSDGTRPELPISAAAGGPILLVIALVNMNNNDKT